MKTINSDQGKQTWVIRIDVSFNIKQNLCLGCFNAVNANLSENNVWNTLMMHWRKRHHGCFFYRLTNKPCLMPVPRDCAAAHLFDSQPQEMFICMIQDSRYWISVSQKDVVYFWQQRTLARVWQETMGTSGRSITTNAIPLGSTKSATCSSNRTANRPRLSARCSEAVAARASSATAHPASHHGQCGRLSRNMASVTPEIIHFHEQQIYL